MTALLLVVVYVRNAGRLNQPVQVMTMSTCLMTSLSFTSLKPSMLIGKNKVCKSNVMQTLAASQERNSKGEAYQACKAQMGSISVT